MPEGPSIVIAKEELSVFIGKKVVEAIGNAKIDMDRMEGKVLTDVKSCVVISFVLFIEYLLNIYCISKSSDFGAAWSLFNPVV